MNIKRIRYAAKYTEQIMSAQSCFLWIINRNFQMIILFWLVYQLLSIIYKSDMFLSPAVAAVALQVWFHSWCGSLRTSSILFSGREWTSQIISDQTRPETELTRPWDRLCSFFFSHFLQLANHNHRATRTCTMIMIMKTRSRSTTRRKKMSSTYCQWPTMSVQAERTSAFCKTTAQLSWKKRTSWLLWPLEQRNTTNCLQTLRSRSATRRIRGFAVSISEKGIWYL